MENNDIEKRLKQLFDAELPLPASLEPESAVAEATARAAKRRTRRFAARAAALAASAALCVVLGLYAADGFWRLGSAGAGAAPAENGAPQLAEGFDSQVSDETVGDGGVESAYDCVGAAEESDDGVYREAASPEDSPLYGAQDISEDILAEEGVNDLTTATLKSDSDALRAVQIASARARAMLSVD